MQTTDIQALDVHPITNHVFILADTPSEITDSGLWIPPASRQQSEAARGVDLGMGKGVILAVGPGKRNKKGVRVSVGLDVSDRILYRRFAGVELNINGVEHRLVEAPDVFAVIEIDDPCRKSGYVCVYREAHAGACVPDMRMNQATVGGENDAK